MRKKQINKIYSLKLLCITAIVTALFSTMLKAEVKTKEYFKNSSENKIAVGFTCNGQTIIPIYTIQGSGTTSPFIAEGEFESVTEVIVKGVVTARSESLFKGFYLQGAGDGLDETSDGIFIFLGEAPPASIQPGVEVCVQGFVNEYDGMTQINIQDTQKIEVGEQGIPPSVTNFYINEVNNIEAEFESVEGMKIKINSNVLDEANNFVVSRNFSYDYDTSRNNMILSYKNALFEPTQLYAALTEEAIALSEENSLNQLVLESDYDPEPGVINYFSHFNAETGYIRINDIITDLEGIINYSEGKYRLLVTNQLEEVNFIHQDDRIDTPAAALQGDIRVATFNVMNFFTSDSDIGGPLNPVCVDQDDANGGYPGCGRGVPSFEDFQLQRTKIVNTIIAMNADIIGLIEIENNGFGDKSAIQNLLDALNSELTNEETYSFIEISDSDKYQGTYFGTDNIMVGLFYRPSTVQPFSNAFVIPTPVQDVPEGSVSRVNQEGKTETNPAYNKSQRHSLGQTFIIQNTFLTVVVNHLKSKGSACLEDWLENAESSEPADSQGHCNAFRVSAATVIADSLNSVPGDILLLGDMNTNGMEDPIRVFTDFDATKSNRSIYTASHTTLNGNLLDTEGRKISKGYGFINLNSQLNGTQTHTFIFSGRLGSLDHILGNASVAERMVAIESWNISSSESNMFEFTSESSRDTGDLLKSENVFSSSDHDPIIIALDYSKVDSIVSDRQNNKGGSLGLLTLSLLSLLGVLAMIRKSNFSEH
ncbi:ExeM/NucH family extracellular endonuclease [uncultured Shewanella sp.]|uniref:ExeM/NucH family extracellular endonuclease n=1 Tax=uncultured Shewanella sp. TaxID=173975 RepID=UPI0026399732|nr:ExeM/NucH family extracellular endonuclease [uncultured Shewanella sp.]